MSSRAKRTGLMLWPMPGLDAGFERGVWAEQAGYDDVWLCDAEGLQDPITMGAALGVATKSIRLCTGIVPVFNRPPPLLATAVLAAEEHARGRFVLGLGSSTGNMIKRWYGLDYEKPLSRVRESVALLRDIFAGNKTNFGGKTIHSHGFTLKGTPSAPIPIYLAALGPKMMQLAGEVADGVVLNDFTPPDKLTEALEQIDLGAKRAGRRIEDLEIVKRRAFLVGDDEQDGLDFFRRYTAVYASAPAYQNKMIELGYEKEITGVKAGYEARDRSAVNAAISDELVDRIYAYGNESRCKRILQHDFDAGIDTVIVSPQARDSGEFARAAETFMSKNVSKAAEN